jgi:hypothetical protein
MVLMEGFRHISRRFFLSQVEEDLSIYVLLNTQICSGCEYLIYPIFIIVAQEEYDSTG